MFELVKVLKNAAPLQIRAHHFLWGKKYCVQGINRLKSFVPKTSSLYISDVHMMTLMNCINDLK